MVAVRVGEDDVFDPPWVEAKLLQAAENLILRGIVEQCLDDDEAVAADEGPGAVDLGADEIEVVGDLGRFGIPAVSRRRCGRSTAAPGTTRWRGSGCRRNAQPKIRARPVGTCGVLRRR